MWKRPLRLLRTSYRVGARLTRAVPGRLRYGAAGLGGRAWYVASRGQARAAHDNYAAVLGLPAKDPEVARVARCAFGNYGQMMADFLLMGGLSRPELIERVSVDGLEHLEASLAPGRGCIMAVPHMGSWDMGGSLAAAIGYPFAAVAERFPGSLDEAVVETRQSFGLQVIPIGRSAVRRILDVLAQNSVVALLCDLPQGPGVEVSFFGRRAVVPSGPAAFAFKSGACVMPGYVYRTGPGRYHAHLEPPLVVEARGHGKADVVVLMQSITERLESFIRARPEQWYAFRPMFTAAGARA